MLVHLISIVLACVACAPLPQSVPIKVVCSTTDGDTIRCGDERIRLLGIDAPELPGHCREGRICAPGNPATSTETLRQAMKSGPLTIRRFDKDRYQRTLALVSAGGRDLSCAQIEAGQAVYVSRWDNDGALAAICPAVKN